MNTRKIIMPALAVLIVGGLLGASANTVSLGEAITHIETPVQSRFRSIALGNVINPKYERVGGTIADIWNNTNTQLNLKYVLANNPNPPVFSEYSKFGTKDYFTAVKFRNNTADRLNAFYRYVRSVPPMTSERASEIRGEIIHGELLIMMNDINVADPELLARIPSAQWDLLCQYFNKNVVEYGRIDSKLHYFRNKLNRPLPHLQDVLDAHWEMFDMNGTRYHMNNGEYQVGGETLSIYNAEYNLKFVSPNGLHEVVFTPIDVSFDLTVPFNWKPLTEQSDPINMGTYNYCASMINAANHNQLDVLTYKDFGNSPTFPFGITDSQKKANGKAYDKNAKAKSARKYWEGVWASYVPPEVAT
ncbi:MAG: hypothetical protein LBN42_02635 [Oscillospiraceae bacterium]|nr:hypothetical protein [Oscillospiraceae bacterium]